jgi:hypothetical protein
MPRKSLFYSAALLSASCVGLILFATPGDGQESILPPGFGDPAPPSKSEPKQSPQGQPKQKTNPDDGGNRPSSSPTPSPAPSGGGGLRPPIAGTGGPTPPLGPDGKPITDPLTDDLAPPPPRYDLPAGSRRSLDRIGPLTPDAGGMGADAFGTSRGPYLSTLMQKSRAPFISRWGSILLRRVLLSGVDTPANINGADWAAERSWMLLRMGEAQGARLLMQSVDPDKASARFVEVMLQTAMANADPGAMCPYGNAARGKSKESGWDMGRAMCAGLSGEPGTAGVTLDRVRRTKGAASRIDIVLAEKVLGAGLNARRSVQVKWDDVSQLTAWRFGLATATGVPIPENLYATVGDNVRGWRAVAPMLPLDERVASAPVAASMGVLSNRAYVDLLSAASDADGKSPATSELADNLRLAYTAPTGAERLQAMQSIWSAAPKNENGHSAYVLTARAAAALPVSADSGDAQFDILKSLFAGGFDTVAVQWVPTTAVGSRAWGLLAVGSPRPLTGITAGAIDDYSGDDDSEDYLSTKLLIAGLAGLDRISAAELASAADDFDLKLSGETRWSRAIQSAADRGEQGTVALLAAVGMQGRGWDRMSPVHLFHIVSALRKVGLPSEARMIAAEAVSRT